MNEHRDDEHTELAVSAPGSAPPAGGPPGGAGAQVLPAGTRLGDFEIVGLLGVGGFGIVYRAHDTFLDRDVALKEYMPSSLASRTGALVHVQSERHEEMFQAGLRSFINEARMLAHFDHPALVKVYQFWEAGGTAYMVMPFYHGRTLKQVLHDRAGPPDEAWLRKLLAQLLDALELIHAQRCYHRDIAPDNILMLDDTRPLLLDFGAARRAIEGMTQAFTVILKQGYAPIEQYAEMPGMHQGAWTDLYALASVVHYAIDGRPPPPSVARIVADPYVPLATRFADRYGATFLTAIDQALAVKAEQRPQSVAALRALLDDSGATVLVRPTASRAAGAPMPAEPAAVAELALPPGPQTSPRPPPPGAGEHDALPPGGAHAAALPAAAVGAAAHVNEHGAPGSRPGPEPARSRTPARTPARTPVYAAGAVALALAGIGYAWFGRGTPAPPDAAQPDVPAAAPASTSPATSTPASMPAQPSPAGGVSAADTAPADVPASRPFEPVAALGDIVAGASPGRNVTVQVHTPRVRIGRDALRFSVRSSHAGHVYLFMVGSDRNNFWLLFPNTIARDNAIAAGETMEVPASASDTGRWRMDAGGPPGVDHLVVMVSDVPRRFDGAGLVAGDVFAEFPIDHAARLQRAHAGKAPLFAGAPECPTAACSPAYGAAAFTVEEVAR